MYVFGSCLFWNIYEVTTRLEVSVRRPLTHSNWQRVIIGWRRMDVSGARGLARSDHLHRGRSPVFSSGDREQRRCTRFRL